MIVRGTSIIDVGGVAGCGQACEKKGGQELKHVCYLFAGCFSHYLVRTTSFYTLCTYSFEGSSLISILSFFLSFLSFFFFPIPSRW